MDDYGQGVPQFGGVPMIWTLLLILVPLFFLTCCCSGAVCCGLSCEQLSQQVLVEVETLSGDCVCGADDEFILDITCSENNATWPSGLLFLFQGCEEVPGRFIAIQPLELFCNTQVDVCEDDFHEDQPIFTLEDVSGGEVPYVMDLVTACCDPLFLEFEATAEFCQGDEMADKSATVKLTITEYIPP
jgi:hypothetical protein